MAETVPTVSLHLLRRYLLSSHWNVSRSKEAFELFEREGIELVLPRDRGARSSHPRAIDDALRTLSQFEDRSISGVASDVHAIGFDCVRSRLPDGVLRGGGVSLEVAQEFVTGAKRLLASAATSELVPSRAFHRVRKEAVDYSNRCVFGHTFKGSFGFVIESPVSPNNAPTLFEQESPPFERRVIERLVRGIRDLDQSVANGGIDDVVRDHVNGFSANMCEDFATLVEKVSPSGLIVDVSFSPEWQPRAGVAVTTTFSLNLRHAEVAEAAARELRKVEIELNRTITGRVFRLESRVNPQELLGTRGSREIAVAYSAEDLGDVRVLMNLEPEDYLRALEAHRQGLAVSISGRLDRVGRSWRLVEHGHVQIGSPIGPVTGSDYDETEST